MQSLQDVDNLKEHSKTAGFSVSSKPNFKDPTGSISASVGRIDSKWKSVTHQAGIYAGEDGYDKIFDKKKIEERQELARLFAKNAFEEVHRLSDKYDWKDGSAQKVALHAAIGEIAAQLACNLILIKRTGLGVQQYDGYGGFFNSVGFDKYASKMYWRRY